MTVQQVSHPKFTGDDARVQPVRLDDYAAALELHVDRKNGHRPMLRLAVEATVTPDKEREVRLQIAGMADISGGAFVDQAMALKDAFGAGTPHELVAENHETTVQAVRRYLHETTAAVLQRYNRAHRVTETYEVLLVA